MFVMKNPDEVGRRLLSKVEVDEHGCWLYTGARDPTGYSAIWVDGGKRSGHRVSWELFRGPIPPGQVVHHAVCHRRACCNYEHLELTTLAENSAVQLPRRRAKWCHKGHPLTKPNTATATSGRRRCRTCRRAYNAEWMRGHRARLRTSRSATRPVLGASATSEPDVVRGVGRPDDTRIVHDGL
jgi:hypothetical protein